MKVGELIYAMRNSANIIAAHAPCDFEIEMEPLLEEWITALARQWAKRLTSAELHARFETAHRILCRVWESEVPAEYHGMREDIRS